MADDLTPNPADTSQDDGKKPAGNEAAKPNAGAPDAGAATPNGETRFSQADLDRIVKDRIADEKKRSQKTAEEEAAKRNGEWQKLADSRQAEIDALSPRAEAGERYASLLNKNIDSETEKWPEEVKALDPGADDVDVRQGWLDRCRPLAEKLMKTPTAPDTDAGRGNQPTAVKPEEAKEALLQTGRYSGF